MTQPSDTKPKMKIAANQAAFANRYTYRVTWSDEDDEFVGTCVEFPSLSHLAAAPDAAITGIRSLVVDACNDMAVSGEKLPVPQPLLDKLSMADLVSDARTAAIEGLEAKSKQQDVVLQRVLQHALNVLVAFRIRATDRTVYLLKDMTADDLETAVSVAELTRLAIEHKCEGVDLLTKPPVETVTDMAMRDTRDHVLGARGGIF